jgi:hypothetical protein
MRGVPKSKARSLPRQQVLQTQTEYEVTASSLLDSVHIERYATSLGILQRVLETVWIKSFIFSTATAQSNYETRLSLYRMTRRL